MHLFGKFLDWGRYFTEISMLPLVSFLFLKRGKLTQELRFGKCLFIGDPHFLEASRKAMEILASMDGELFEKIRHTKIILFLKPRKLRSISLISFSIYGMDDRFLDYNSYGLIAFVVSCYFCDTSYTRPFGKLLTAFHIPHANPIFKTYQWLSRNNFPSKLVSHYGSLAREKP